MSKLISCAFHFDTGAAELQYSDGIVLAIDCTAYENEIDTIQKWTG